MYKQLILIAIHSYVLIAALGSVASLWHAGNYNIWRMLAVVWDGVV